MLPKGNFIKHLPCEVCGSSDAKGLYSSGTAYCFSCHTYFKADGSIDEERRSYMKDLIPGEPLTGTKRGIHEETFSKFGYEQGTYNGDKVHVAPYYHDGKLVAQHTRTKDKKFAWIGNSKQLEMFGQHLWQTGGKRLVITEGELDCLSVAQVFNLKWPVVSLPSGAQSGANYIKQNLEWIESFEEIVIAFDNDEAGQKAIEDAVVLLTPGKVKVADWSPLKDANDWLQDNKGSEIANRIFQAKEYRPDGIMLACEMTLEDLMTDDKLMNYQLPYPKLDDMMKGIRKGELTTLTAGSGIGKSTLAREIAYHLLTTHNLRVGYVALEESVKKTALGFISIDQGVPLGDLFLNRQLLTEDQWKQGYERTIESGHLFLYDHFGSLSSNNLVSKLRYLALGCGCDFLVLDHLSIVVSGMDLSDDERRTIDALMTNSRSLVEQSGVGLILINHLKVPQKGKPHEEGGRVTLNDLRGSGSIKQLSDNLIALERNQQSEKTADISKIRILKNRLFGVTGLADEIQYSKETGRLLPVGDAEEDDEEEAEF